jgi:anti-sigma regulatory factor (Ser/Thr protein kinase)
VTAARLLGTQTFAALPDQISAARGWFTERLNRTHPAYDDALLLLSETFTNGVRHSNGNQIEVSVFLEDQGVRVEVVDGGGGTVPQDIDDPLSESGRGLPIIRALASKWGFEEAKDRLRVWFTVPIPPPEEPR